MTPAQGNPWAVPHTWAWAQFGEVAAIAQDLVDPKSVPHMPHIAPNNIEGGSRRLLDFQTVEADGVISPKQRFVPGQVLFSKIRPYLRKAILATFEGVCSADMYPIWPGAGLEAEYLLYWLTAEDFRDIAAPHQGRTLLPKINQEGLNSTPLPMPPLAEQRRIVAKLDALTARTARARAELDRIPALAARQKQAVLSMAMSGELSAAWRLAHPYERSAGEALAAVQAARQSDRRLARRKTFGVQPSATIPRGWSWVSPDEAADDTPYSIGIGPFGSNLLRSDYREQGVRLIFVRDIRRERFDAEDAWYVTSEKADELYQHVALGGDVLVTKMGEPPGDTALYPLGSPPAVITADCVKLRPHPKLALAKFLVFGIRAPVVTDQIAEITVGVAQQKISLDRFRQIALPMPPLEEQAEIVRRVETAFAEIDRLVAEAAAARRLLDRLDQATLAKAFRGELVRQDPADEPASVLLECIRADRASAPAPGRRGRKPKPVAA